MLKGLKVFKNGKVQTQCSNCKSKKNYNFTEREIACKECGERSKIRLSDKLETQLLRLKKK